MESFLNNKIVTLKDLKESNEYQNELIENLERREFKAILELLSNEERANISIMEPILYAIKNEFNTYEVYRYYATNLQDNTKLAAEIIKEEPELIKNTPVSRNEEFILQNVKTNPDIIKYMSTELKKDTQFLENLYNLNEKEISINIAKECNIADLIQNHQELAKNPEFMVEAIKRDVSLLKYVNEELKNNYEFIQNACIENNDVIDYVANNTEIFGVEALAASKNVLIDVSTNSALVGFEEESKKIEEQLNQKDENNIQNNEELIKQDKRIKRHIELIKRIQNGKYDSKRAAVVMKALCKNMDEKYKKQLEQYIKIEDARINRKEQIEKNQINPEQIAKRIENENIRETKIEEEFLAIKEEVSKQRNLEKIDEEKSLKEEEH